MVKLTGQNIARISASVYGDNVWLKDILRDSFSEEESDFIVEAVKQRLNRQKW